MKSTKTDDKKKKLSGKPLLFADEYLIALNATQSAIKAGYSAKTAYSAGHRLLKNVEVQEYIQQKLRERHLGADEAQKLVSDMARSNLSDYMIIKKVEHVPRIEVGLQKIIDQLLAEIKFKEDYKAALLDECIRMNDDELKIHEHEIQYLKKQIIHYQLNLKKSPNATKIIDGPVEWVETTELDMPALVRDKEKGKIKSITPMPGGGVRVELQDSSMHLVNVLRIHGKFAKDNEQKPPTVIAPMNDAQVAKYVDALKDQSKKKAS